MNAQTVATFSKTRGVSLDDPSF